MSFQDVNQRERPTNRSFSRDGFVERQSRGLPLGSSSSSKSRRRRNSSTQLARQSGPSAGREFDGTGDGGPTNAASGGSGGLRHYGDEQRQVVVTQREEDYASNVMMEREEEMQKINEQVHTVNEIYKDLGHLVHSQQEQVDQLEENAETAKDNTKMGLEQLEEANRPSKWRNPFQSGEQETNAEGGGGTDQNGSGEQGSFQWPKQFDTLREDMDEVQKDITSMITDVMRRGKLMMLGCSAMGDVSKSPIL